MSRLIAAAAVVCALALTITSAEARPKHARIASQELIYCASDQTYRHVCPGAGERIQRHARAAVTQETGVQIIGGRPPGCPYKYCGCGLAKYLGLSDKRLNRAWSWAEQFHRASPGPGMAVVWRHHVALIVEMVGPRKAVLRDYNSGRGLSRIHVRSIAGAVVVNPSSRVAGL